MSAIATATSSTTTTATTLEDAGLRIGGVNPERDLVEIVEISEHPWYRCASSSTRSFKSKPNAAHPLFANFIAAIAQIQALVANADVSRAGAPTPKCGALSG